MPGASGGTATDGTVAEVPSPKRAIGSVLSVHAPVPGAAARSGLHAAGGPETPAGPLGNVALVDGAARLPRGGAARRHRLRLLVLDDAVALLSAHVGGLRLALGALRVRAARPTGRGSPFVRAPGSGLRRWGARRPCRKRRLRRGPPPHVVPGPARRRNVARSAAALRPGRCGITPRRRPVGVRAPAARSRDLLVRAVRARHPRFPRPLWPTGLLTILFPRSLGD